jgi:pSer/pThr/pTyr-binding forkhead associated (FHA) protein
MVLRDDRFASGHHAHVLMDTAGGCTLVDRGSTNGTFVNGVREREKRLIHGMLIKIGSTEARFLSH